ncbi:ubiquinone biosynthesis protein Coq4 [Kockiozyma suomiensis]|uniref:ubiquinone biosynthesis protein Coq4 n=1 Tax=Kockiozyma suomiensis TaxID=1337062 RepID=UPI003343C6C0
MRPKLPLLTAVSLSRRYTPQLSPSRYPGHVPTNMFQKTLLAVGSGVTAFFNPRRGDIIATLGEATALPFLMYRLRDVMLSDATGRRILREKPRITSKSLNIDALRKYPANSVGKVYSEWLDLEGVSPDTRAPVRYIDDPECAYVMQRYRECHDFYHAITGLPIIIEGEIALKMFEFANTLIPMTGIGALLAPSRLKPKQRERLINIYFPWAIKNGATAKPLINIYWEEILMKDIQELRDELGIEKPPNLRELRKLKISHL